jgi:hypothetical protein
VFNDGGLKHFKLTGYLAHMSLVAAALQTRSVTLTQHHFASYHASGPADAVASHMKKKREALHCQCKLQAQSKICAGNGPHLHSTCNHSQIDRHQHYS